VEDKKNRLTKTSGKTENKSSKIKDEGASKSQRIPASKSEVYTEKQARKRRLMKLIKGGKTEVHRENIQRKEYREPCVGRHTGGKLCRLGTSPYSRVVLRQKRPREGILKETKGLENRVSDRSVWRQDRGHPCLRNAQ